MPPYGLRLAWICTALLLGAACDSQPTPTGAERAAPDARPAPEAGADTAGNDSLRARLVARVQKAPAVDGIRSNAFWVERELAHTRVLFADWVTGPVSETHAEVHFIFTVLDPDYRIRVRGYTWRVTLPGLQVGPPQPFVPDEAARPAPMVSDQ